MNENPHPLEGSALTPMQKAFLQTIDSLASKGDREVFVVGGLVRDIFLGVPSAVLDVDLVLEKDAEAFAQNAARMLRGTLKKHPAFLTFKIEHPEVFPSVAEFDIATARTETYACPGALPRVQAANIQADLRRRDFSINALALRLRDLVNAFPMEEDPYLLKEQVLDFFSGLSDLDARVIRVLHENSFVDDPTRMFRACRYAARIGGVIEAKTFELIKAGIEAHALQTISWFRILTELRKALSEKHPERVFSHMDACGIMETLPCVPQKHAAAVHDALLRLARPLRKHQDLLFAAALRIFAYFADEEAEPTLFRAASLSNEIRESILRDLDTVRSGRSMRSHSDEALLLGAALEESESRALEYDNALKKRGLLE